MTKFIELKHLDTGVPVLLGVNQISTVVGLVVSSTMEPARGTSIQIAGGEVRVQESYDDVCALIKKVTEQ